MKNSHLVITSPDLAVAWGRAFAALAQRGTTEIAPLIVNISGFEGGFPAENPMVRQELQGTMEAVQKGKPKLCLPETTANLIFPESLWLRHRASGPHAFFRHYTKLFPRLKKRDPRNRKGTYFLRLIEYGPSGLNQLAHVLDTWNSGTHRRSALQTVVFDPAKDHSRQPFLGFPCLDYVTFTPNTHEGTLAITALYAEQYLFDRGYGNYLGLCRLGRFVADQMKLRFVQLTCIASCAQLGETLKKRDAQALVKRIKPALAGGGA